MVELSPTLLTFTTTGVFTSSLTTAIDGKTTVIPTTTMTGTRTVTTETPITTSINTTFTTTGVFTSSLTTTIDGKTTIIPSTMTGTRTMTTEAPITTSTNTSTQSGDPIVTSGHNQTSRAIVGGVLSAAGFIIMALIIFFVLRHKRRYKASRSTSAGDDSTSSTNVQGQCMSQSAHLSTTLLPFLDFPVMQNYPPTKGVTTDRAGIIPAQNSLGGIKPENPFVDPVVTESNNEGEGQRVRNALDNLQALTSRFEGELQQLCALAQSQQLSAEDSLKLEEIRRTTGLTIQFDSRRDRFSVVRSASAGSTFSLDPPSYHTRGG